MLLGDFSAVHLNLRNGLREHGVDARVLSSGDGYKSIERDLDFSIPAGLPRLQRYAALIKRLAGNFPQIKGNDVVQFVSPFFFQNQLLNDTFFTKFLTAFNEKVFYLACSSDQGFYFAKQSGALSNLLYDPIMAIMRDLEHNKTTPFEVYNEHLFKREKKIILSGDGIVAPMFDYYNYTKALYPDFPVHFIPFPLDVSQLPYHENEVKGKLIFLHGMHKRRYHFKGSHFIKEALEIVKRKYPNDVEIRIIDSLPYQQYLKELTACNVFVDQTDAYDIGMAALQSLALGRITMSGSEPEVNSLYEGREDTIVNIRPNVQHIVDACVSLIENRHAIAERSQRGRSYVEKNHSHVVVAKKYIEKWELCR